MSTYHKGRKRRKSKRFDILDMWKERMELKKRYPEYTTDYSSLTHKALKIIDEERKKKGS